MRYAIAIIVGYLLGNISFSTIYAKIFAKKDIHSMGSGNPGATNILRTMGLKYAVPVFILDAFKAIIAAVLGCLIIGNGSFFEFSFLHGYTCPEVFFGGVAAILGHNYPALMRFKGGKGVSCTLGLLIVLNPIMGLLAVAFAASANVKIKIYSIVSIVTMLLSALCFTFFDACPNPQDNLIQIIVLWSLLALMIFTHRQNIVRLLNGTEGKINIFKTEEK